MGPVAVGGTEPGCTGSGRAGESPRTFAAGIQFPKAQLLWILGRNAEADRVIDRAMQYWPEHQIVRFARFTIYAYTGRPRAALAMLDDPRRDLKSTHRRKFRRGACRWRRWTSARRRASLRPPRRSRSGKAKSGAAPISLFLCCRRSGRSMRHSRLPTGCCSSAAKPSFARRRRQAAAGQEHRLAVRAVAVHAPCRADARRSALQCAVRGHRADRILGQARDQARLSARHRLEARLRFPPDFARILQHGGVGVALDVRKIVEQIAQVSEQSDPSQPILGACVAMVAAGTSVPARLSSSLK